MTRDEVLGMPAGVELDALVAEHVMGITPAQWRTRCYVEGHKFDDYEFDDEESGWCYTCGASVSTARGTLPPPYSTNIAAAWAVVEHVAACGVDVTVELIHYGDSYGPTRWAATFGRDDNVGVAAFAPLAICISALRATLWTP